MPEEDRIIQTAGYTCWHGTYAESDSRQAETHHLLGSCWTHLFHSIQCSLSRASEGLSHLQIKEDLWRVTGEDCVWSNGGAHLVMALKAIYDRLELLLPSSSTQADMLADR